MADSPVKGPRLSLTLKKPCRVLFESMGICLGLGPQGRSISTTPASWRSRTSLTPARLWRKCGPPSPPKAPTPTRGGARVFTRCPCNRTTGTTEKSCWTTTFGT